ncbi:hydrophobin [Butyriboletus roseoflavus]|nr:hydrophobin [Butyriboletus roseoflavus]
MLVHHSLSVLPFVALAYGGPLIGRNPQCDTGSMQCCQSMQPAGSPALSVLASLLGLDLPVADDDTQVGLQCSSLSGAGSGCEAQPVCCSNTSFNGLINMGCSPINL